MSSLSEKIDQRTERLVAEVSDAIRNGMRLGISDLSGEDWDLIYEEAEVLPFITFYDGALAVEVMIGDENRRLFPLSDLFEHFHSSEDGLAMAQRGIESLAEIIRSKKPNE